MADTARTLAQLQALLADNTTSDISPQDLRDVLLSALGGYGGLYAVGAGAQTINIAASKLEAWTGLYPSSGTTPDATDNSIEVAVAANYLVTVAIDFLGTDARTFTFQLRLAGVAVSGAIASSKHGASSTDVNSVVLTAIVAANATDKLSVYVSADVDASSITVQSATMSVKRVS